MSYSILDTNIIACIKQHDIKDLKFIVDYPTENGSVAVFVYGLNDALHLPFFPYYIRRCSNVEEACIWLEIELCAKNIEIKGK